MAIVEAPTTLEQLFLAGEWAETGSSFEVRSPYSGEVVATVAQAGAGEARRAIDAAEQAMQEPLPPWRRADILERVSQLVRDRERGARAHDLRGGRQADQVCACGSRPRRQHLRARGRGGAPAHG